MIKPGTRGFVLEGGVKRHGTVDTEEEGILWVRMATGRFRGCLVCMPNEDFTPAKHDIPGEEDASANCA